MRFLGYTMIIGAMKSGTTSLHFILEQHPAIVAGVRKELNFFKGGGERTAAAYEKLFPRLDKTRHAYTLDSSPNYTKAKRWSVAPRLIAALPGRKRLVYLLRNPIERIDSHIAHNVAEGRWTPGEWPMHHVVETSAYARRLAAFEQVGLLDDVLLIDFSELSTDPIGTAYRVHDFLGIGRVKPKSIEVRNPRKIDAEYIHKDKAAELKDLLKDDVQTLITRYGFEPARNWDIVERHDATSI